MDEIVQKTRPSAIIRRFVIEIPLFFVVVLWLDYEANGVITAWNYTNDYNFPHPFWFGILVFGLTYGIAEGVLLGVGSSILYVIFSPYITDPNPLEWGRFLLLPASFIIVGVGVGIFHFFVMKRLDEVIKSNENLTEQVVYLDKLSKGITEKNLELEKKIVLRMETFQTIYEIAETLNELDMTRLGQVIPSLVAKHVKAEKCSFFLITSDKNLYVQSMHGWAKRNLFPNRYSPEDRLYKTLDSYKETSVVEPDKLKLFNIDAYLVSALIDTQGKLIGMIKIEDIDFDDVSEESINFFQLLSEWIMYSVNNALSYSKRRKESLEDAEGIIREEDFWYHLQKVVNGSLRHKHNVMMIIFSQKSLPSLSKNSLKEANLEIGRIIRGVCRLDDKVGIAEEESNYQLLVMLPFTERENIEIVLSKLKTALTIGTELNKDLYDYYQNFDWEILSFDDGSLFIHDIVLGKLQRPM